MSTVYLADFFENQPNEICSHFSEKLSKGRFLKPEKLQNHSNEGKGKSGEQERRRREKSNGCTLSFPLRSFCPQKTAGRKTFIQFGHNVFKNAILWFTVIGHFRVSWASVSKRG